MHPQRAPEVVVVTGASAGLGRATAMRFARDGAHIGLIARGQDRLEATRQDVVAAGGQAIVLPADVADASAVEAAAERVEQVFGPLTIWVNNAMTAVFSEVKDMRPEEYRRVMEVTFLGQVHGTLAALRRMLPRDGGVIVQIGSALAYRSIPLQSSYCAAKHAVLGFTQSLRSELLHYRSHVRVTMVEMPGLNTPQFDWVKSRMPRHPRPLGACYEPEVGAEAVVWAARHPRREVKVGYPTLQAIYGTKILPGIGDRYLADVGFRGQQTDEAVSPDRPNNLWAPVPGPYGARGSFSAGAKTSSLETWLATRGRLATLAGTALLGVAIAARAVRSQRR
jgi:NAD(P)-dependent dehydrogenase (short-subunit alcohol dehydrogenase family)